MYLEIILENAYIVIILHCVEQDLHSLLCGFIFDDLVMQPIKYFCLKN